MNGKIQILKILFFLSFYLSITACGDTQNSAIEQAVKPQSNTVINSNSGIQTFDKKNAVYMASDAEFYGAGMEAVIRGRLQVLDGCVVIVSEEANQVYLALMPFGAEFVKNDNDPPHIAIGTDQFNFYQTYNFTGGSLGKSLEGRGLFKTPVPESCSRDAYSISIIRSAS